MTVRVLSQNTKMLPKLCPWGDLRRAGRLARHVGDASPRYDVVGLQEVFGEPARKRLAKDLTHPHQVEKSDDDLLHQDSGLFFASHHPIVEHSFVEFSAKRYTDSIADKGVFAAQLDTSTTLGGATLCVFHAHLQAAYDSPSQYAEVRSLQFAEIVQHIETTIASLPTAQTAVLLIGDLNVVGDSPEYDAMMAQLGDARDLYRHTHPNEPGFTFDGVENAQVDGDARERLDYMIAFDRVAIGGVWHDLRRLKVEEIRVVRLQAGGRHLSDHFGLDATLRV